MTRRLIIRQYNVPFGFRFFFNSIESYKMLEISKLCPKSSTLTITNYISSRFDKYLKIKEEVSYCPSPIKPQNDTFIIKKVQGINTGLLFPASITKALLQIYGRNSKRHLVLHRDFIDSYID